MSQESFKDENVELIVNFVKPIFTLPAKKRKGRIQLSNKEQGRRTRDISEKGGEEKG